MATIPKKVKQDDQPDVWSSLLDLDYLSSISRTLSEWESEEDEKAFKDL